MLLDEYLNDIIHMKAEYIRVKKENINIPNRKGIRIYENHNIISQIRIPFYKNYTFGSYNLKYGKFTICTDYQIYELTNEEFTIIDEIGDEIIISYNFNTKEIKSIFEEIKTIEDFNEETLFYLKLQDKI